MSESMIAADLPEFPMARTTGCPFGPPQAQRELATARSLSRVRIRDRSTHWLVTGHAEQRIVVSDPRVSADERGGVVIGPAI